MHHLIKPLIAAASLLACSAGIAQSSYPTRPVTFIVSQAAGGPNDVEARLYAGKMSEVSGQKFVVDYKPGAGTVLGTAYVAKAPPDGYTLLAVTAAFTIFPSLYKDLNFDIIKDFTPVSVMSNKALVLMVRPDFPARTFQEYVAYARANPGKINYGTSGSGGGSHLIGAWMHNATGTRVTFIPYKGTPAIVLDMLAGRMDATPALILVAQPLLQSGKLRGLAITGDRRSRLLPNIPTVAESGIPGYNYTTWMGFSGPAGLQPAVLEKLNGWFVKVARMPEVVQSLESDGADVIGSSPAQFRQLIVSEAERWAKLVKEAGIKADDAP